MHGILFSRSQRILDDPHVIVFKQDLVMVRSNFDRILRQSRTRAGHEQRQRPLTE